MKNRTDGIAERFKERMRHVQRYRCVRDWRNRHPDDSDVLYTKNQALELAAAELEAAGETTAQKTIENSYDRVSRDLKRLGQKSEFFWLVARSDPTRIPVSVTRRADGVTVINGVAQRPKGGPTVGQTIRGARSLVKRSGGDPTVSPAIGEARSLAP